MSQLWELTDDGRRVPAVGFTPSPEVWISAARVASRLRVSPSEAVHPGAWGCLEHLCHELGHLLYDGLPIEATSLSRVNGNDWCGEGMAWAITQVAMPKLGLAAPTDEDAIYGCKEVGVPPSVFQDCKLDPRVATWADRMVEIVLFGAEDETAHPGCVKVYGGAQVALESYDGVDVRQLDPDVVIDSDRDLASGPLGWWQGRVFALRHPDPAKLVLAVDDQFCGVLSGSRVLAWDGSLGSAVRAIEAELESWAQRTEAGEVGR